MKNSILFVTYDFHKDGYPSMPYSIAVIIAAIKSSYELKDIVVEHYSVSLTKYFRDFSGDSEKVQQEVAIENKHIVDEYKDVFNHIAVGVNAWSRLYAQDLLVKINSTNYKGVKILGGYDITSSSIDDLKLEFPNANYYIKGYAEQAIISILLSQNEEKPFEKELIGEVKPELIHSPYILNVWKPSLKVYLETKRGCPHHCGFCEWGNFKKGKVAFIDKNSIVSNLQIFSANNVEEINVLDGTFNCSKGGKDSYVDILNDMLVLTQARITLQCRFEDIDEKEESNNFLDLCTRYKERISLEFGIQTTNEEEMKLITRNNNLPHIGWVMNELNKRKIGFSVSVIYGIPNQTLETFISTIDWIAKHNCINIFAYPLRIPRNSKMHRMKNELGVVEQYDSKNVKIVKKTNYFTAGIHDEMTKVSELLFKLQYEYDTLNRNEPLIFFELTHKDGVNSVSTITSENRMRLNKEFIKGFFRNFTLFKEADQSAVSWLLSQNASFTELMPYYKDPSYIQSILNQIEWLDSKSDIFWRIIANRKTPQDLRKIDFLMYDEFKQIDSFLLELILLRGAWVYDDKEEGLIFVNWTVFSSGFILIEKDSFGSFKKIA